MLTSLMNCPPLTHQEIVGPVDEVEYEEEEGEDEEEDVVDLAPELLLPLLPDLALLLTQLATHHSAAAGQGGTIQQNLVGFLATLH